LLKSGGGEGCAILSPIGFVYVGLLQAANVMPARIPTTPPDQHPSCEIHDAARCLIIAMQR
jgi:hypothetical protein